MERAREMAGSRAGVVDFGDVVDVEDVEDIEDVEDTEDEDEVEFRCRKLVQSSI